MKKPLHFPPQEASSSVASAGHESSGCRLFDLKNLNLLRNKLIEKPQAEQVSSDLCSPCLALCWEFVRIRQRRLRPGLFCIRRRGGRRFMADDKRRLCWARRNPALAGVYNSICFALHRLHCQDRQTFFLHLAHAIPALVGSSPHALPLRASQHLLW